MLVLFAKSAKEKAASMSRPAAVYSRGVRCFELNHRPQNPAIKDWIARPRMGTAAIHTAICASVSRATNV